MMPRQKEKDEGLIFTGSNVKLLAVKVSEELYDALEAEAEEQGLSLPELVRRQLRIKFFPQLLKAYTEGLKSELLDTPLEELGKAVDYYDSYYKQLMAFFEESRRVEAEISETKKEFDEAKNKFVCNLEDLRKELWERLKEE